MANVSYEVAFDLNLNTVGVNNLKTAEKALDIINKQFDETNKAVQAVRKEGGGAFDAVAKKMGTASTGMNAFSTETAKAGKSMSGLADATQNAGVQLGKFSKGDQIAKLNAEIEALTENFDEAVAEAKLLAEATEKVNTLRAQRDEKAGVKPSSERNLTSVSGVKNTLASGADAVANLPFLGKLAEQAGSASGGISGLGGSLASLANPATAAAAGAVVLVGALASVTSEAIEGVQEINKLKNEISALSGLKGNDLDQAAAGISASAKSFGLEQSQILETVNAVAQNRKISFSEAQKIVTTLVESGASEEGLKRLREYDIQFRELGITGKESVDVIRVATAKGIFDDKFEDSLKEGGIKLKEFSQDTQDSLKPLGKEFNAQLKKDLNEGKKTGFQLFQDIANQAKKAGLSEQDTQKLVAGVFGSPGEDVGSQRLIDLLANYQAELAKVNKETEAQRKSNKLLNNSQKEVELQFAELGKTFTGTGSSLTILKNEITTFFLKGLNSAVQFGKKFIEFSAPAINFFQKIGKAVVDTATYISDFVTSFIESSGIVEDLIEPLIGGIQKALAFFYENILNFINFFTSIPGIIGKAFSFIEGVFNQIKAVVVGFAPIFKPVFDFISAGFEQVRRVVGGVVDAFSSAGKAGETLGKVWAVLNVPLKALIETLSLALSGLRVLSNTFKQTFNDITGTKTFEVDPKLNVASFQKDVETFAKKASTGFITQKVKPVVDPLQAEKERDAFWNADNKRQKEEQMQRIKAEEEERKKLRGGLSDATGAGQKPPEVEIKLTADLKPFESAIQKAETDIQTLADNSQTARLQFEFDLDQASLDFTEAAVIRRTTDLQEKQAKLQQSFAERNAKDELDRRKADAIKALDAQRLENQTRVKESELSAQQKTAKLKEIEQKYAEEIEKIAVANGNDIKALDQKIEEEREALRKKFANQRILDEQNNNKKLLKELEAQEQALLKTQRDLITETVNNTLNFDGQQKALKDNTDAQADLLSKNLNEELKKIGLTKDQEINLYRKYNQDLLALQLKAAEESEKIEQKRADRQFEIASKNVEKLEKQANILQDSLSKINSTVKIGEGKNLDATAAQLSASTEGVAQITAQIAQFRKQQAEREKQIKLLQATQVKLNEQKSAVQDKARAENAIQLDPNATSEQKSTASENAKKNEEILGNLEESLAENEAILDDLEKKGKRRALIIIAFFEIVANAITSTIQAGIDATLNSLNNLEKQQEDKIDTIKKSLAEGTKAKEKYTAEELQFEEQRLKKTQDLKKEAVEKERQLAIVQLIIQSAVAVAKAAAEGGILAPFTIGATLIALAAGLAQANAQAQAAATFEKGGPTGYRADPMLEPIGGKGSVGVVHEGEFVSTKETYAKNKAVLEAMHAGAVFQLPEKGNRLSTATDLPTPQANREVFKSFSRMNHAVNVTMIRDISRLKEMEAEMQAQRRQMDKMHDAIRELARAIDEQDIRSEFHINEKGIATITNKVNKREEFRRRKSTIKH